jgi:hypothetical protein
VPDHVFFERRPGVPVPYPEARTLMTAISATTERVQIGSADGEPLRSTLELFAHEVLPRVRKMQVTA